MAAADCTLVKGLRFQLSTDNATWTTMPDMVSVGAPATPKRPKIDKTPLDPQSAFREYSLGLAEAGEQSFKQLWNKSRESLLQGYYTSVTLLYVRILYPDATLDANKSHTDFPALLSELSKEEMNNADAKLVLDGKCVVVGAVTFTPGS